jgi:hypothetical protein
MISEAHARDPRIAWILLVSFAICIAASRPCRCDSLQDVSEGLARYDPVFGHACGPVNLYAGLRILGKDVDFGEVVSKCNLDGYGQSDLATLEKVAASFGVSARSVHMNVRSLKAWDGLAILHLVEPRDHFVLYTGTVDGKFRLVDGTHRRKEPVMRLVSGRDLHKVWDGNALIIASHEINVASGAGPTAFLAPVGVGLALGLVVLVGTSLVARRLPSFHGKSVEPDALRQ